MSSSEQIRAREVAWAITILRQAGCKAGYLLGSVAQGTATEASDLDIAVSGLAPERFFAVYSKLALHLSTAVDLIDLDDDTFFTKRLKERGDLQRVF